MVVVQNRIGARAHLVKETSKHLGVERVGELESLLDSSYCSFLCAEFVHELFVSEGFVEGRVVFVRQLLNGLDHRLVVGCIEHY